MRAYKTEINPTPEQKRIIHQTIGTCRYIYNFYLAHNKEIYEKEKRFVSGMDFSKWLNNNHEFLWIKQSGSKAIKQSIMNGEKAFKRFFRGQSKFPKFKKKNKSDVKAYFPKNNKGDWTVERHRIKVPTLGFVRLKEKGYIPAKAVVKSGTVSIRAGRYYVSVLVDEEIKENNQESTQGIGIDLGLKDFAICSNGLTKKNVNKTKEVKRLEKKLKREQRCLSRKYEDLKKRNKNNKKGEATRQNIQKQVLQVQKLHQKLTNVRTDFINKTISEIIKQKPSFITIEDLNVSGMMKNRHLSKVVAQQKFYEFRNKLIVKCKILDIELRIVDTFYPSSKLCHECGQVKKDLKLSDRKYICGCGYEADRDYNASLNLRDAKVYKIA
jgi:putative transposase